MEHPAVQNFRVAAMKHLLAFVALTLAGPAAEAGTSPGPYPPAAGQPGSDAIAASDPRFKGWATSVVNLTRGWDDVADPFAAVTYGGSSSALGPADLLNPQSQPGWGTAGPFPVVSLGDGGSITLAFATPIADGAGPDLAVFENGLNDAFLELAFVEVSSDGIHFFRFPAISCTQVDTQVSSEGALNPRNLKNLAGKYRGTFGTPFDLGELASVSPLLNVNAVTRVRIVDVVGTLQNGFASLDSTGRKINDPYPTPYETGGFDLDAVGVLNQAVTTFSAWVASLSSWPPGQNFATSDPDGDGIPNLLEYALSTDPLHENPPASPAIVAENGGWRYSWNCRASSTDLSCRIETSSDLKTWLDRGPGTTFLLTPAAGAPSQVVRLRISLQAQP